ncbi:MAG: hypothetical protein M3R15_16195 [Acidobacteriota bacterium]|nr:hypothetical protein [Burkholderiales bacterium]MDQ3255413.1 hypothetical protein [Acidobacteriota bacterium]
MLLDKIRPLLRCPFKPSRKLACLLIAAHLAALVLLWLAAPGVIAAPITPVIIASAFVTVRQSALHAASRAIVALELDDDCLCAVQFKNGEWREALVLGTSFVAPYLTIVNLKIEGNRFAKHVVILPDAVDAELFRQLRVLLRWKWRDARNSRADAA